MNQLVLRGLFLASVGLAFGIGSLRYKIGGFGNAGPGLFPLMISIILVAVGLLSLVRARLVEPVPMTFHTRGFAIILATLCGFALVSRFVNMSAGIVYLVFCASLAGASFNWRRNLQIAAALLAVAFAMQKLLGLELPLY